MPNDQQANNNQKTLASNSSTEYQRIKFGDWQKNNAYASLVTDIYREQAIRIIQRFVRKIRRKREKPISFFTKNPVVKNDYSQMSLLSEPTNDDYEDLVEKIISGEYDQLVTTNTDDAFRNLYKALRLDKITLNQFYLAYSIIEACEWYYLYGNDQAPTVHRVAFGSDQDKYDLPLLLYATKEQSKNFYNNLADEDRYYFTIDFPKSAEHVFFYHLLKKYFNKLYYKSEQTSGKSSHAIDLLKKYIDQFQSKKKELNDTILTKLKNGDYNARDSLLDFIAKKVPAHLLKTITDASDQQSDSIKMILGTLIDLDFFNSGIIASPSYDENNAESPVLSVMLTTLNVKNKMLTHLFDSNAFELIPTAGKVTTRMIRADLERENLSQDSKSRQTSYPYTQALFSMYGHRYHEPNRPARPIEMSHPDLINTNPTHDLNVSNLSRRLHDEGHTIHASASFGKYFKYLLSLLSHFDTDQADIIMSPSLWKISDMILFLPTKLREAIIKKDRASIQIQRFELFIGTLDNFLGNYQTSLYYHFLRDIVLNESYWNDMVLNLTPGIDGIAHDFLGMINEALAAKWYSGFNKTATQFKNDLQNTALINFIRKNPNISTKSLILSIQLGKLDESLNAINICANHLNWLSNKLIFKPGLACFIIKNTSAIQSSTDICLPSQKTLESIFSQLEQNYVESTVTRIYMDLFNRKNLASAPFENYANELHQFNEMQKDQKDDDTLLLQKIYTALGKLTGEPLAKSLKYLADSLLILSQLFHFRAVLLQKNTLNYEEKKLLINKIQENAIRLSSNSNYCSTEDKCFMIKTQNVVKSITTKLEQEKADENFSPSPRLS